jgi:hypothetical protein
MLRQLLMKWPNASRTYSRLHNAYLISILNLPDSLKQICLGLMPMNLSMESRH